MSKLSLEENTKLADEVLTPIIQIIDHSKDKWDVKRLKETLEAMENQTSMLAAFPTEETMNKAKNMRVVNEIFEKIVELIVGLIELRKKQKEVAIETNKGTVGENILKHLGM